MDHVWIISGCEFDVVHQVVDIFDNSIGSLTKSQEFWTLSLSKNWPIKFRYSTLFDWFITQSDFWYMSSFHTSDSKIRPW